MDAVQSALSLVVDAPLAPWMAYVNTTWAVLCIASAFPATRRFDWSAAARCAVAACCMASSSGLFVNALLGRPVLAHVGDDAPFPAIVFLAVLLDEGLLGRNAMCAQGRARLSGPADPPRPRCRPQGATTRSGHTRLPRA